MIYDRIENIARYKGLSHWLDQAVEFIENTDLDLLPEGRTEICGSNVFANVMQAEAKDEAEAEFEVHHRYMDIQIDLEGVEKIQTGGAVTGEGKPFDKETDFGTVLCEPAAACVLGKGRFVICMPGEPHKPGIATGSRRQLKKCVIKTAAAGKLI